MFINAAVVKANRLEKGWTQQQLADVSGLSLRTIQRVENQGQGSIETTNALCAVFELERPSLLEQSNTGNQVSQKLLIMIASASIAIGFLSGVLLMFLIK